MYSIRHGAQICSISFSFLGYNAILVSQPSAVKGYEEIVKNKAIVYS